MTLDLIDAVIATLEMDVQVDAAFGSEKFWADYAPQVDPPYCVIQELGETYDYMTAVTGNIINYTSPGQMMFSIYAPGRYQTRQLGELIAKALNDAPLKWPQENTMIFRMVSSRFNPLPPTGPGVPTVFNRIFVFEYTYSGSL